MNAYYIDGCAVHLNTGVILTFDSPITHSAEIESVIAIRTKLIGRASDLNNVYGIINNEIAWQIENAREFLPWPTPEDGAYYSNIEQYKKDPAKLLVTEAAGSRFIVDPLTGKIVGRESWTK